MLLYLIQSVKFILVKKTKFSFVLFTKFFSIQDVQNNGKGLNSLEQHYIDTSIQEYFAGFHRHVDQSN